MHVAEARVETARWYAAAQKAQKEALEKRTDDAAATAADNGADDGQYHPPQQKEEETLKPQQEDAEASPAPTTYAPTPEDEAARKAAEDAMEEDQRQRVRFAGPGVNEEPQAPAPGARHRHCGGQRPRSGVIAPRGVQPRARRCVAGV